jgi:hypothetical protein
MKYVLVVVATMVLAAVLLPFLYSSVLDSLEKACVFCLWEELQKAGEAWDRFMAFSMTFPIFPWSFIFVAQWSAFFGIGYITGMMEVIYQSGYEAGMSAGASS